MGRPVGEPDRDACRYDGVCCLAKGDDPNGPRFACGISEVELTAPLEVGPAVL
jgi:hypothetical protein